MLRTLGTFILFLFVFSTILILIMQKIKGWRSSFVLAFLGFGTFAWILTEILSLFNILTPTIILLGWILLLLINSLCILNSYRNNKLKISLPKFLPFQWEHYILLIILFLTFLIAVAYPPNNWDSMTYHLPRVEHWLQNRNINHYYTSIDRQLFSAPFNSILVLQGRALSGDDFLMNLVQWFSFIGSIIGLSKIANYLGMDRKGQVITALFFSTVPMAILQASSTQSDLVVTFCIVCLVERFYEWKKTGSLFNSISFGLALGLSILAKGTAYAITLPFVLCFAVISLMKYKKRFIGALMAAIICLMINFPHFSRNYMTFNNPIGSHHGTVSNFSLKSFSITFFANINSNIAFPRSNRLNQLLEEFLIHIKTDNIIFPYGPPRVQGINSLMRFHEDSAANFFHIIIITVCIIFYIINKKKTAYHFTVIASFVLFSFFIPWQPWITRLQLPLFALSAPIFSLALVNYHKLRKGLLIMLALYAMIPLFMNRSRPIIAFSTITNNKTIWNSTRDEIIFNNRSQIFSEKYQYASAVIITANPNNIGIIIGGDSWEYPLWQYIRKNFNNEYKITHISSDSIGDDIDVLFILDQPIPALTGINQNNDNNTPIVIGRDFQNRSEWIILYE